MISIIIVSFNTRQMLIDCLQSVMSADIREPYEVLVIDNNSSDGSQQAVRESFANVLLVANPDNRMYAGANNQGIALSKGEFILLLNSDTKVPAQTIDTLLDFLRTHPQVAAIGPKILDMNGECQSIGHPPDTIPYFVARAFALDRLPLPAVVMNLLFPWKNTSGKKPRNVGWISGACFVMRRQAVDRIGALCEDLYFYGEEVDWCYRAKKAGYQICCLPDVSILHYGGASAASEFAPAGLMDSSIRMKSFATLITRTIGYRRSMARSAIEIFAYSMKYVSARLARRNAFSYLDRVRSESRWFKFQLQQIRISTTRTP